MFEDRRDIVIAVLALLIIVLTIVTLYKKEGYDASHPQCSDENIDGGDSFSRGGDASKCPDDFYPSLGGDPASVPLFVKIVQPNYKHCRKRRCEENASAADAAAATTLSAKKARMKPRAQQIYDRRNHSFGESMAIYREYQAQILFWDQNHDPNDPNRDEYLMQWYNDQMLQSIINGSYFGDDDGPLSYQ